ncbi:MAG: hypothetical protein K0S65_813, partial [Labilithrix sp.]|nr:hypothetical protein [Labilithrix sp.]
MSVTRLTTRSAGAALGLAFLSASACGDDRPGFGGGETFVSDAGAVAPECYLQCSLDARSVIQSCTGEIVETCPVDQACGGARCQAPCAAAVEDRSSNGCDFYFQRPPTKRELRGGCYAAFVVNTSTQPVNLTLELEGQVLDISKSVFRTEPGSADLFPLEGPIAPNESAILFVSDSDPTNQESGIACPIGAVPAARYSVRAVRNGMGSAFHLSTNVPVSTAALWPFGGANSVVTSATLLLPVATWSKQHILVNAWEAHAIGNPSAQIFASEDDTELTILPVRDIQDGPDVKGGLAGKPAKYRLNKGQLLQLVQSEELSGSVVQSTKPTATFGGHECTYVPTKDIGACDNLGQQIPAVEQWGAEYVGVGYRPRLGNEHEPMIYRIVAARDGTRLDYDPEIPPGAPVELAAGEVATFAAGTGDAFVVRTQDVDHPVYLAAYMRSGSDFGGKGDPEFVNVVPVGQYLNKYSFYADPTYSDTSLVIV